MPAGLPAGRRRYAFSVVVSTIPCMMLQPVNLGAVAPWRLFFCYDSFENR